MESSWTLSVVVGALVLHVAADRISKSLDRGVLSFMWVARLRRRSTKGQLKWSAYVTSLRGSPGRRAAAAASEFRWRIKGLTAFVLTGVSLVAAEETAQNPELWYWPLRAPAAQIAGIARPIGLILAGMLFIVGMSCVSSARYEREALDLARPVNVG
jgi:hypothetical protein